MANTFTQRDPLDPFGLDLFRAHVAKPVEGEVLEIVRTPRNPDGTQEPRTERSETKGAPR